MLLVNSIVMGHIYYSRAVSNQKLPASVLEVIEDGHSFVAGRNSVMVNLNRLDPFWDGSTQSCEFKSWTSISPFEKGASLSLEFLKSIPRKDNSSILRHNGARSNTVAPRFTYIFKVIKILSQSNILRVMLS